MPSIRIRDMTIYVSVDAVVHYKEPPCSESLAIKRSRFDAWIRKLAKTFEAQVTAAFLKQLELALHKKKIKGNGGRG